MSFVNKMFNRINLKGYEAFKSSVEKLTGKNEVNVYFTGSKNDTGVSWCPDCVSAEPHVLDAVEKFAKKESIFMYVDVGDRTFWKDMKNPFRTDKDVLIQVIPTLIRWKAHQRLEGPQCENKDLLEMFFTEADD
ncbi:thioredoxin domain-containing protein 17-like [Eupeodes corollae]|uniref:thioredoxin domain-containing protein 17-like n=1 Tax=Eupeodes corollae TaxID=290404 RepID=UPI002491EB24|nr:thioredoxin domain-containing protein 17-like [Eupeodes corollae]